MPPLAHAVEAATAPQTPDPAARPSFLADLHNRTILFRAGHWIFTTYGVFVAAAFFLGVIVALWHDAALGHDVTSRALFYLLALVPAVLIGARAFSVLLEWRELFARPLQTLLKPGYMLHGGVLGGALAIAVYARWTGEQTWLLLDSAALALPLGESIARFGCLVYGCCWGKATESRFGIRYTSAHAKVNRCAAHLHGKAVHPAQMYASVLYAGVFAGLMALAPHKAFDGMIAAVYLVAHPIIRIALEQFRDDDRGRLFGRITHTNLYSAVQLGLGLALTVALWRGGNLTPVDAGAHPGDVLAHGGVLAALGGITALVALVFGVHYKQVGSWIEAGGHDHGGRRGDLLRFPDARAVQRITLGRSRATMDGHHGVTGARG